LCLEKWFAGVGIVNFLLAVDFTRDAMEPRAAPSGDNLGSY
jgi:hypothetical protein